MVQNLYLDSQKKPVMNNNSKIIFFIEIFNKYKIIKRDLKSEKNNIEVKILKQNGFEISYKDLFRNIEIKEIDLSIDISTEDAALTAILVGFISSFLGVIIKKQTFKVNPLYINKNFVKIHLNGIFKINLRNYIYNQFLNKKRRDKNERTSNRKSYDDCYE